jgi:hypothetical protein
MWEAKYSAVSDKNHFSKFNLLVVSWRIHSWSVIVFRKYYKFAILLKHLIKIIKIAHAMCINTVNGTLINTNIYQIWEINAFSNNRKRHNWKTETGRGNILAV